MYSRSLLISLCFHLFHLDSSPSPFPHFTSIPPFDILCNCINCCNEFVCNLLVILSLQAHLAYRSSTIHSFSLIWPEEKARIIIFLKIWSFYLCPGSVISSRGHRVEGSYKSSSVEWYSCPTPVPFSSPIAFVFGPNFYFFSCSWRFLVPSKEW